MSEAIGMTGCRVGDLRFLSDRESGMAEVGILAERPFPFGHYNKLKDAGFVEVTTLPNGDRIFILSFLGRVVLAAHEADTGTI